MAGTSRSRNSMHERTASPVRRGDAVSHDVAPELFGANGNAPSGAVVYVLGDDEGAARNPAYRHYPRVDRERGQAKADHLARVVELVTEAMAAGGTHLLVPRELAGWLSDHPHVADYFGATHALAGASVETGIVFRLLPPGIGFDGSEHGTAAKRAKKAKGSKGRKSKRNRAVWKQVDRLEQRVDRLQAALRQSRADTAALAEALARAQPIIDSVPAIAKMVAEVNREVAAWERRRSHHPVPPDPDTAASGADARGGDVG